MRLTSMSDAFLIQMEDHKMREIPFEDRFGMLVDIEYSNRKSNSLKRLIRNAGFDQPDAYIGDINYTSGRKLNRSLIERLATCEYITEHRNLFITGATGSGKTYLACAFGMEAFRRKVTHIACQIILYDVIPAIRIIFSRKKCWNSAITRPTPSIDIAVPIPIPINAPPNTRLMTQVMMTKDISTIFFPNPISFPSTSPMVCANPSAGFGISFMLTIMDTPTAVITIAASRSSKFCQRLV